jgi:hypothetical protein
MFYDLKSTYKYDRFSKTIRRIWFHSAVELTRLEYVVFPLLNCTTKRISKSDCTANAMDNQWDNEAGMQPTVPLTTGGTLPSFKKYISPPVASG